MTVFTAPDGTRLISWMPGDMVDWHRPNAPWHGHVFCGNCGLDFPGCGCPRGCPECIARGTYCGHRVPAGEVTP